MFCSGLVSTWLAEVGCHFVIQVVRPLSISWASLNIFLVHVPMLIMTLVLRYDFPLFFHWSFCWFVQCQFGGSPYFYQLTLWPRQISWWNYCLVHHSQIIWNPSIRHPKQWCSFSSRQNRKSVKSFHSIQLVLPLSFE